MSARNVSPSCRDIVIRLSSLTRRTRGYVVRSNRFPAYVFIRVLEVVYSLPIQITLAGGRSQVEENSRA